MRPRPQSATAPAGSAASSAGAARTAGWRRTRLGWFAVAGLTVALFLAGIVSFYASGSPDGLERVAGDHGFADQARDSAASGSPFADYAASGVGNDRLSVLIAGVVGVLVTVGVAVLVARLANRRRAQSLADQHDRERERVHR